MAGLFSNLTASMILWKCLEERMRLGLLGCWEGCSEVLGHACFVLKSFLEYPLLATSRDRTVRHRVFQLASIAVY